MSDWWDSTGLPGLVDPAQRKLGEGAAPQAQLGSPSQVQSGDQGGRGGSAMNNWLAFTSRATGGIGFDAARGQSGASSQAGAARGNLQGTVDAYNKEFGTQAKVASGDRIDFGDGNGSVDVIRDSGNGTSGFWWGGGGGGTGSPQSGYGGGSGGGGGASGNAYNPGGYQFGGGHGTSSWTEGGGPQTGGGMPAAPTLTPLTMPAPFESSAGAIGRFTGPMAAAAPGQVGYQNATAPGSQSAQQLGRPQSLNYQNSATPTAFSGSRQAAPGTLSYENLATPDGYAHQDYKGPTAEEMAADPSYKFRLEQGQNALENSAASKGMLRTGNTAKGLIDYGQGAASQEYAAIDARSRATNAANNAGQLGAYQTNAQTGLAYGQDRNSNAFQFGQANISNAERSNSDNYARASGEAQQGFQNQNAVEQQNNAGGMNAAAGNNAATLARTQANNQANLAYGGQNFSQGFAVNQANNQGNAAAISTNNAANQAAQAQAYGQAANTFGANTAAQAQQYGQQLGAYQTNTGNAFQVGQANNQNALQNYIAQGNLGLGYQNSNQSYALGQGQLGLGYQNSNNAYALGQGQLGLGYGQLGLATSGQQFNQGLATYDRNYAATVTDPFNQASVVAGYGRPTAPAA